MTKLIDVEIHPIRGVLDILLEDKSTKKNIIWATDIYELHGSEFSDKSQITKGAFLGINAIELQPRISKDLDDQRERTRKKAEVFTPVWLCNMMNNFADEKWFGTKEAFNTENDDNTWSINESKIEFGKKSWKKYVDSRRLEITCGEAPYLVSRYDTTTGELIYPLGNRIGILDRKLRIVNENTENEKEWLKWAERAVESCYGYEYQGDSLLIARINVLLSFYEYYKDRWNKEPDEADIKHLANVIAWNIWQMDGMKDTVPLGKPYEEHHQINIFELLGMTDIEDTNEAVPCRIKNWRANESLRYMDCKEKERAMGKKLFDFVIGNPPYQEEFSTDGNKTYAAPVYDKFLDAASEVGTAVELIHPARFLFNAGSTPKAWNEKMLNDPHFKVLHYEEDASKVFSNTEIKGGVAITYHDDSQDFEPIVVFTKYPELNSILNKVKAYKDFVGMEDIVITRTAYRLTDKLHENYPDAINQLSKGHAYDMSTNIFDRLPQVFFNEKPTDDNLYIRILGRENNQRVYKFIRADYVNQPINLHKYKIVLPSANGAGNFGETLSQPLICEPFIGSTETFISVGAFNTENEANALYKYIHTKFSRAMLGVLKSTQHLTPEKWKYVPLQDFTVCSDIDWSKSIAEIDQQLYAKYNLSKEEIMFIETNVKEMV